MIQSVNPFNEEIIASYEEISDSEALKKVDDVQKAFQVNAAQSINIRADKLKEAAKILRNDIGYLSRLITTEMGKPVQQSKGEIEKCAWLCDYYADNAEKFLADQRIDTDASRSYVTFQPLGIVLGIMPWNFPFWQVFRFAVPTLAAGNAALLKHASNVTGCALAIERIFLEAGFPENTFKTLILPASRVSSLISNKAIKAVTLTGSTPAGRNVASTAGHYLKKSVLELGGSDPYIILDDADIDEAVSSCVTSRLINNGQSCIAAKRFIVTGGLYDEFIEKFVDLMSHKAIGDPLLETTALGPLARKDLLEEVDTQVQMSISKGARLLTGGRHIVDKGYFYDATVLDNVQPGMPCYDDEIFGPVASVIRTKDENDAIRIANHSSFGLGAAIFTSDMAKGEEIAKTKLQAGSCFVNAYVRSDPRLPFGGINESGYGRELSEFGIREFVNIKTVYIR
ncbi:MAG: NAD-dependent succinate-semialdehyde dehydrogenase [Ignavibacteriaceae bacterium]|nr:NAD-dependent succinate-semialdehyde dehydrogenase [Ignavibacteriaceae bacterium]